MKDSPRYNDEKIKVLQIMPYGDNQFLLEVIFLEYLDISKSNMPSNKNETLEDFIKNNNIYVYKEEK